MTKTLTNEVSIRTEVQLAVDAAVAAWEEAHEGRLFAGAIADGFLDPATATAIVHSAIEEVATPLGFEYFSGYDGVDTWPHCTAPIQVAFSWDALEVAVDKTFGSTDTLEQAWVHVKSYEEREVLELLTEADSEELAIALAYWDSVGGSFLAALEDAPERYTGCRTLREYVECRLEEREDIPEDLRHAIDVDQLVYDVECGGDAFESEGYVFWHH
jgi:hypothetical protein